MPAGNWLTGLASVVGAGVRGYAEDKERKLKQKLAEEAEKREQQKLELEVLLAGDKLFAQGYRDEGTVPYAPMTFGEQAPAETPPTKPKSVAEALALQGEPQTRLGPTLTPPKNFAPVQVERRAQIQLPGIGGKPGRKMERVAGMAETELKETQSREKLRNKTQDIHLAIGGDVEARARLAADDPVFARDLMADETFTGGTFSLDSSPKGPAGLYTRGSKGTVTYLGPEKPSLHYISGVSATGEPTFGVVREGSTQATMIQGITPEAKKNALAAFKAILPSITDTIKGLSELTDEALADISSAGVNFATWRAAHPESPINMLVSYGAGKVGALRDQDVRYQMWTRAIGDAVARANEVGMLSNQDVTRYQTQIQFLAGDSEQIKKEKKDKALSWALWLRDNALAIQSGNKGLMSQMPGETPEDYRLRTMQGNPFRTR